MRIGPCAGIRGALCPWSGSGNGLSGRIGIGAFFGREIAGGVSIADSESNQLRIPVTTRRYGGS